MDSIPQLFTEKKYILSYDFNNIDNYINNYIDRYIYK